MSTRTTRQVVDDLRPAHFSEPELRPMDLFVPDYAIDVDEVLSRGGRNFGDEHFAVFRCPDCGKVYLIDHEVDIVFTEGRNLAARVPISDPGFRCVACGSEAGGRRDDGPAIRAVCAGEAAIRNDSHPGVGDACNACETPQGAARTSGAASRHTILS